MSRDADTLAVRDGETVATAPSAQPTPEEPKTGFARIIQRITSSRPVRVFQHYNEDGGPLLAAGMSYNAVFATFAALWVTFSIAGFIIGSNPVLKDGLIQGVNSAVPGLLGEDGAVNPDDVLSSTTLSWTGAIALVGLVLTALGFLASMRDAVRRIFNLPPDTTFFLFQKVRDLGLALGFGVLIFVSAGLSFLTNGAVDWTLTFLGIDTTSLFAAVITSVIGYVLVFLVDFVTVAAAFRILSAVPIPIKRLA